MPPENGSYAQIAGFAKSRERPKGDINRWSGMPQCRPSDRTFAAAAPIAVIDTGAFDGNHLESEAISVDKGQSSCESEGKILQRYQI